VTDTAIRCKKCKQRIFYIPKNYSMNISVTCISCHDGTTKSKDTKPVRTAAANYAKVKKGKRLDIHPSYSFRSATEMNFARILNLNNLEWKYEERVFTFSGRTRKPFLYIMDFEIIKGNKEFPAGFYEVKGRMKPGDRNKLRLLKKHYPEEYSKTHVVIYSKYKKGDIKFCEKQNYRYMFYDALTKKYKDKIEQWE
jgi:hypothetical protein